MSQEREGKRERARETERGMERERARKGEREEERERARESEYTSRHPGLCSARDRSIRPRQRIPPHSPDARACKQSSVPT